MIDPTAGGATLEDALSVAADAWSGGAGAKVMTNMASRCVALLGGSTTLSALRPAHGRDLLTKLAEGRSPKSVANYYGAFRRMLAISGTETDAWPKPQRPPRRRAQTSAPQEAIEAAMSWLRGRWWTETADLARLIVHTGLRPTVEALRPGVLKVKPGEDYDVLEVSYRGGRKATTGGARLREIPVTDAEARAILKAPKRMRAILAVAYTTHLQRLRKAAAETGAQRGDLEPRALRAAFERRMLVMSGGNKDLVADLMGRVG